MFRIFPFFLFFFLFSFFFLFPSFPLFLFLFVKACPMYVDRAHTHAAVEAVSAVAAAEQPEGWRFVPDTILPGYQWAPQWVPARTPTVHWGPISGKAVGGPNTVHHSRSQCEKHPKKGSGAMSFLGKSCNKIHENHDDQYSVKCAIPGDGYRRRSGTRRP